MSAGEQEEYEEEQNAEWVTGHYPWVRVDDDDTGNVYYFNEETSESSWDHPSTMK